VQQTCHGKKLTLTAARKLKVAGKYVSASKGAGEFALPSLRRYVLAAGGVGVAVSSPQSGQGAP
jgi:hypothetical protein